MATLFFNLERTTCMQPLSPSAMQFVKHSNHDKQQVILPDGVPFDVVNDPHFWSYVAKRLSPFDEIQVIPEDGSWIAELYVVQCGDFGARVALRSKTTLEAIAIEDAAIPQGYSVKFSGPVVGWSVLRGSERIYPPKPYTKAADKADAIAWLKSYTRTLAA